MNKEQLQVNYDAAIKALGGQCHACKYETYEGACQDHENCHFEFAPEKFMDNISDE